MHWRKNVLHLVAAVSVFAMLFAVGASAATGLRPDVRYPAKFGVSPPMSSLPRVAPPPGLANRERPNAFHLFPTRAPLPDPVVQRTFGLSNMPAPITTFDGIPNSANTGIAGFELTPADTQGAVGGNSPASNVYVQWINLAWAVFDKTTGAEIAGPFAGNSFWAGFERRLREPATTATRSSSTTSRRTAGSRRSSSSTPRRTSSASRSRPRRIRPARGTSTRTAPAASSATIRSTGSGRTRTWGPTTSSTPAPTAPACSSSSAPRC